MSRAQREAFEAGAIWEDDHGYDYNYSEQENEQFIRDAALQCYPDSPLGNVREIVVAYLKDNGYDGLYGKDRQGPCECAVEDTVQGLLSKHSPGTLTRWICPFMGGCRPGVLVDGKIVEREKLSVVAPVSQTGSSTKSTLTTPDE